MFPHQKPVHNSPLAIRDTYPTHLRLGLITLKKFNKEWRSRISSLRSPFHSPVISSLLGQNTFLSTLCSTTISLYSSHNVRDLISVTKKNNGQNCISVGLYFTVYIFGYQTVRQNVLHRKGPDFSHKMKVSSKAKSYINIMYFASGILLRAVTLHFDGIMLSS